MPGNLYVGLGVSSSALGQRDEAPSVRGSLQMETIATFRAVATPPSRYVRGRLKDFVPPLPTSMVVQTETKLTEAVGLPREPSTMSAVDVAAPQVSAVAGSGLDVAADGLSSDPELQKPSTDSYPEPSQSPHRSTGASRQRSRPGSPRKKLRDQSEHGHWSGVAVLAVVAAIVWVAVFAVEHRSPASKQQDGPVVRLAVEPNAAIGGTVQ